MLKIANNVIREFLIALVVSFIFIGVVFNVNFGYLDISDEITSVRLSIFLLICINIYLIFHCNCKLKISVFLNNINLLGFASLLIILLGLLISFVLNGGMTGIEYIVSSILQLIGFLLFCFAIDNVKKNVFINVFLWVSVLYLVFLYMTLGFDFSNNFYIIRQELNSKLPQGLNRFLNGFVMILIIPFGVLFGSCGKSKINVILSSSLLILCVILAIYSGSRQYIVSVFLLLVAAIFVSERSKSIFWLFVLIIV